MRILLAILLAFAPCAAWADVSVVTQIHPSYVGSTITAVATRDGVDLATAECTTATNTSGFAKATASLDLSGAGAGYVQVAFLDEFGDPVSTGTEFEIDGSGDPVDRLAYIDAATSSRLAPTEEGRTLDVTANGNAGIDWGNVENPTTSINFSSTTVGTATNVGGASLRSGLGMAAANMDTQLTALESLLEGNAASIGDQGGILANIVAKTAFLPSATAGSNGGLPTVDANNRVAGIQGTINTLDALDAAQDSQHTATQNALSTIDSNVDSILEDTGTTLPGTLSTIDGNVDAILEDTGTTLPGTLAGLATQTSVNTIDGIVDNIYTAFELDGSVYRLTTNALEQGGAVSLDPEDIENIADATALAVGEGLGEAVWTYDGDRLLTAGTNIVLEKDTGITGFNDLDAAGMRSALGMSAADLDTQLGNIPTTAEFEARTIAAADYVTASDLEGITFDDTDILAAIGVVDGILDNIYTAFEADGGVYRLTTNALEQGGAVSLDPEDITNIADATANAVGEGIGASIWTYDGDRTITGTTPAALTAESFDSDVTFGADAEGIREAVGLASANLDTQLESLQSTAESIEGVVGSLTNTAATILQHDIAEHFVFKFSGRNDGLLTARNTVRLSTTAERPRIGFDVKTVTVAKPGQITSVQVLDSNGATSEGIVVAPHDDTTNTGVRDWLVMTKVTSVATSGTYTVRVTFVAADNAVYVVQGRVVVP